MDKIDTSSPIPLNGTTNVDYVTVVTVGTNESITKFEHTFNHDGKDYITVLKIGTDDQLPETITEEVLVYRLPGEKLGFGLKFEGGTKSAEFVKRLFIQSCALNSPASRVQSSWGPLVEGDEVLEIDSIPVNTMTRIDCVRCLKDSNVVIKLLIQHRFEDDSANVDFDEHRSKSLEDLPLVISAEKKRTPPPPPPVPPRKVNRKSKENAANIVIPPKGFADYSAERQNHEIVSNNSKTHRLQSPYNSFRKQRQSPEVIKRIRRLSDDVTCPPDAEVYIDLFSQESAYSLSESDDTGSSISTVVDRLGSYPTTTNSSFAGSLPSTPTPIQRHIYLTEDFDFNNDNYLFSKLITSQPNDEEDEILEDLSSEKETYKKTVELSSSESVPLQPPVSFQDAPLSYGNEDVKIIKSELRINLDLSTCEYRCNKPPPPPPPRTKSHSLSKNYSDEDVTDTPELPRLVDFVPKSNKNSPVREVCYKLNPIDIVRKFLENEQYNFDHAITTDDNKNHIKNFEFDISISGSDGDSWCEDSEFYSLEWSSSSKLATIGEDEEEITQDIDCVFVKNENPVVIIENADVLEESCKMYVDEQDDVNCVKKGAEEQLNNEMPIVPSRTGIIPIQTTRIDVDEIMDGPRQPPDGHEFPDQEKPVVVEQKMPTIEQVIEKLPPIKPRGSWISKYEPQVNSVRDKIAIFSKPQTTLTKKYVSTSAIPSDSSSSSREPDEFRPSVSLFRNNSVVSDSTSLNTRYKTTASIVPDYKSQISMDSVTLRKKPEAPVSRLHGRSVSLLDINDNSNKFDRWSLLIEQRRLSKLKGLVIPEHEPETDSASQSFVDLPEIRSVVTPVITPNEPAVIESPINRRHSTSITNYPRSQPTEMIIPKYSPAFKRRSFQIHPASNLTVPNELPNHQTKHTIINSDESKIENKKTPSLIKMRDFSNFTINNITNDPPKSLESITSPTRSDYSFEFNTIPHTKSPSGELRSFNSKEKITTTRTNSYISDIVGSSEYESDTDSALSSSQSSYMSRNSPPASPIYLRNDPVGNLEKRQLETISNYESLNRRLLKPQSLEAINRKNILASARCRSGRDLKVGSPLIQRKFEDNEVNVEEPKEIANGIPETKPVAVERQLIKEKAPVEIVTDDAPSPKARSSENIHVPKIVLREVKNILTEKTIEPNRRSSGTSGYYSQNYPIVRRASSVTDLRKNFEKITPTPAKRNSINSVMTTTQPVQPKPIKRTSLPHITPLVNPVRTQESPTATPTIENVKSLQNYDQIIDDAIKYFDEAIQKSEVKVVNLKPDVDGGSLGITLAGGADYETKEITIHKIRDGSPAYRDGRLQKGDKILAINEKYMKGLSHAQSLKALKENVPEVIIIACKGSESNLIMSPVIHTKQFSFEAKGIKTSKEDITETAKTSDAFEVSITKDATGLGFSIQGGKGSPQGDVPLIIKKIFMGGAAEKAINLKPGDELLEIHHADVTSMSRMEAWNLMKKLPEQEVILKVRR